MPCNCRVPLEKFPETAEWGPLFWKLLHALAERAGSKTDPLVQGDERRTWIRCIKELGPVIPCDVCQTHYSSWLSSHPVDDLLTMSYNQVGPFVRNYFWSLHNVINEENERPVFAAENLSTMYGSLQVRPLWKALEPVLLLAMRHNKVSYLAWLTWLGHVRTLQGMY